MSKKVTLWLAIVKLSITAAEPKSTKKPKKK